MAGDVGAAEPTTSNEVSSEPSLADPVQAEELCARGNHRGSAMKPFFSTSPSQSRPLLRRFTIQIFSGSQSWFCLAQSFAPKFLLRHHRNNSKGAGGHFLVWGSRP